MPPNLLVSQPSGSDVGRDGDVLCPPDAGFAQEMIGKIISISRGGEMRDATVKEFDVSSRRHMLTFTDTEEWAMLSSLNFKMRDSGAVLRTNNPLEPTQDKCVSSCRSDEDEPSFSFDFHLAKCKSVEKDHPGASSGSETMAPRNADGGVDQPAANVLAREECSIELSTLSEEQKSLLLVGIRVSVLSNDSISKARVTAYEKGSGKHHLSFDNTQQEWVVLGQKQQLSCLGPRGRSAGCSPLMLSLMQSLDASGVGHTYSDQGPRRSAPAGATWTKPSQKQLELVGRTVIVFWQLDASWYPAEVVAYSPRTRCHHVLYHDGEDEWLDLSNEEVMWASTEGQSSPVAFGMQQGATSPEGQQAVGWRIAVYSSATNTFREGRISEFDSNAHHYMVLYDDAGAEMLSMADNKVIWRAGPLKAGLMTLNSQAAVASVRRNPSTSLPPSHSDDGGNGDKRKSVMLSGTAASSMEEHISKRTRTALTDLTNQHDPLPMSSGDLAWQPILLSTARAFQRNPVSVLGGALNLPPLPCPLHMHGKAMPPPPALCQSKMRREAKVASSANACAGAGQEFSVSFLLPVQADISRQGKAVGEVSLSGPYYSWKPSDVAALDTEAQNMFHQLQQRLDSLSAMAARLQAEDYAQQEQQETQTCNT